MQKINRIFSTFIHLNISPGHTYVIRITLTHYKITRYSSDSFSARRLPAAQEVYLSLGLKKGTVNP